MIENEELQSDSPIARLSNFFWANYPHEISWREFEEINPELYCQVKNAGQALVLAGKLTSKYLED